MARNKAKFIIEIDEKGKPIIKSTGEDFERLEGKASKTGRTLKTLRSHWLALTAAFAAGAYIVARMTRSFVQAAGEAEMFQTQLLGVSSSSEEALKAYKEMLDFAARTPHMTQDVISAFVMLRSVGMDPTIESMRTMGDVAFLFNRNIQDVGSALISFEKEVLRRLGIEIDRTGEKVKIMSGSMIVETENAATAIREGLLKVWEIRFSGAMKTAETTWKGAAALFKSAIWEMQKDLGIILMPGLKLVIQWMTNIIFRIRDWAATNREAAQDIVRNGIMKIIEALKWLSYAIEMVKMSWSGWKQIIVGLRILVAKFFEYFHGGLLKIVEAVNRVFGGLDEELRFLQTQTKIWASITEEEFTNLYQFTDQKNPFKVIREELDLLMEEVRKKWPELTRMMSTPIEAPPTKPTAPGVLPKEDEGAIFRRRVEAMAEMKEYERQWAEYQAELHNQRMTSWDLEMERIGEMVEQYGLLGTAIREFINVQQIEDVMVQTVGSSIKGAILGYEGMGKALKKALAETLAAITAEAAVRALFNTALGFSYLALGMAKEAAAAFTSAKVFAMTAAMAGAAAVVARAAAGGPESAERRGYAEARGAGVAGLAREGETEGYAQKIDIHLHGDVIAYEDWAENTLLPVLKKIGKRDTEIDIYYD